TPVVPRAQLVDLVEVPPRRQRTPLPREPRRVATGFLQQRRVRLRQLLLVQCDCELDLPQPPHPRERPAECLQLRTRIGPEVAHALPQRLPGERASKHVLLERLALAPVARRLRPRHTLPENRVPLTPFHAASVPGGCPRTSKARSAPRSTIPSAKR